MTEPRPHGTPATRRAARLQRERDAGHAQTGGTGWSSQAAGAHPPIFRPPPPPERHRTTPVEPLIGAHAEPAPVRHAARRRAAHVRAVYGLTAACVLLFGGVVAVSAAVAGHAVSDTADARLSAPEQKIVSDSVEASIPSTVPVPAESLPAPTISGAPATVDLCASADFTAALASGDDAATIAAAGGAEMFRQSVAAGTAPCVSLADPTRTWLVVNKTRPYDPTGYAPSPLALPAGVQSIVGGELRADAAASLSSMAAAAAAAGVGEIALESGYRSYQTQVTSYGNQVSQNGAAEADLSSARPGYSEHQSGLTGDLVACDGGGCGTLDDLAATAQGQWLTANAWQYGWITRYEDGRTDITGYMPEPWHLRYIGVDLAKAYHDGGWHTLEEFFGLPAAPTYVG
ncbi:M15 family metallopeptidase [Microbacterium sp. P03]|uniref:M15 family metallopeptidase n=1 Tax=Microbacterium sp. P03 TaxID=3366946 RepID=UPI00374515BE